MPIKKFIKHFERFFKHEATGGYLLIIVTFITMLWANSPWASLYQNIFQSHITIGIGNYIISEPLTMWINDGLMSIFFLAVGLEIKREVLIGELSSLQKANLPIIAALGGMIFPALIYFAFNHGTANISGWGVPIATDIAFALAVLNLMKSRVPRSLLVFLTAFAIADDIGAVIVIAIFYTAKINLLAIAFALMIFGILVVGNLKGITKIPFYIVLGFGLWLALIKSGVHPTISGVLLGMVIPAKRQQGQKASPLSILESALQTWVAFGILPLFALANAGIKLQMFKLGSLFANPVALGIVLGLVIGKPLGITLFSFVSVKLKLAKLPRGVKWKHIFGAGILGGVGFTMAIFVAQLGLGNAEVLNTAKIAIIIGSLLSSFAGLVYLGLKNPKNVSKTEVLELLPKQ